MSRAISHLLDRSEEEVTKVISMFEDKNSFPSHDVRLLAHNIQTVRVKLQELGLDPDDTTGEELYQALLVKFQNDSLQFEKSYGEANTRSFDNRSRIARSLVLKTAETPDCWGLKSRTAKDILRQHPPKKLMKQLNYRSLESLLKRENLLEIYLALPYSESPSWYKEHSKLVSRLEPTSFEPRRLTIQVLSSAKYGDMNSPDFVAKDLSMGSVAIWPSRTMIKAPLLTMILVLLETLAGYKSFKLAKTAAAINSTVAWWADMDGLIANPDSEVVSMNLKDVALNHLHEHSYAERLLDTARLSFWEELLNRYEKKPKLELDLLRKNFDELTDMIKPLPAQPELEYIEEI
ncbi:MAG TPA: hypothetical protein VFP32_02705 [Candidatus Saccharimonadales bacterium]|nr:hypothetical protein [Candidatus Saccharimonadales bacterium]